MCADDEHPLLKACHASFVRTFEWTARVAPGGVVERSGNVSVTRSGIRDSAFNLVFALERPDTLAGVSAAIRRLYLASNTPWELVATPRSSAALRPLVDEFGLVKGDKDELGMLLEALPEAPPPAPPELEIRQVTRSEDVRTFLRVGMRGFGDPRGDLLDPLAHGLSNSDGALRGIACCYLGYVNGEPIATSIRFTAGEIGAIFFVATLPEFRRRGYGEAMTWRAAVDGRRNDGCSSCFLQASAMGYPIYARMGFRKIVEYEIWRPGEKSAL